MFNATDFLDTYMAGFTVRVGATSFTSLHDSLAIRFFGLTIASAISRVFSMHVVLATTFAPHPSTFHTISFATVARSIAILGRRSKC